MSSTSVKVLFAFQDEASKNVFVELKRPDKKGCENISEYVSWFHITKTSTKRLTFKSWDGKGLWREFAELRLVTTPKELYFISNGEDKKKIELCERDTDSVSKDMISACLAVWKN
jgi:hypothetical protein